MLLSNETLQAADDVSEEPLTSSIEVLIGVNACHCSGSILGIYV